MPKAKIQVECYKCSGVGIHYKDVEAGMIEIDPCPVCVGAKYLTISYLNLDKFVTAFAEVNEKLDAIIVALG